MVDPFRVRVVGPLSSQAHGFAAELIRLGYSPRTTRDHVYVLAQLSRWLADEGLTAAQLTPEAVDRFLLARAAAGCRRWRTLRSLQPMLDYLRGVQAVPSVEQAAPESPLEALLAAYLRYLVAERRLAAATVRVRVEVAHRLLSALLARGDFALDRLAPVDVTGFVLSESRRRALEEDPMSHVRRTCDMGSSSRTRVLHLPRDVAYGGFSASVTRTSRPVAHPRRSASVRGRHVLLQHRAGLLHCVLATVGRA